jgi:hypothetical protein
VEDPTTFSTWEHAQGTFDARAREIVERLGE